MEHIQNEGADPKEIQQEQELLKETPVDEIKSHVIEKFGLDEEVDSELIEKLVENETEHRKVNSTAIRQKINWREKALKPKEEEKPQPEKVEAKKEEKDIDSLVSSKVQETLEQRDLDALDISDNLKNELKTYAKAASLTIKQAQKSNYFKFLSEQEEQNKKVEEASIGGSRKSPTKTDFSSMNPTDFDLTTEEGQKGYEEYKKFRAKNK